MLLLFQKTASLNDELRCEPAGGACLPNKLRPTQSLWGSAQPALRLGEFEVVASAGSAATTFYTRLPPVASRHQSLTPSS